MGKYLLKSLLQVIPVLLIISIIVFILIRVVGDPVILMLPETATEEERMQLTEALGLNEPLYYQYGKFIMDAIKGDFGTSYHYNQSALPLVLERLPASFELAFASLIIAIIIALPLGIYSAIKRNSFIDLIISGVSVLGKAMPNFWVGIMLILIFSVLLGVLPVSGRGTFAQLILPSITIGIGLSAQMTKMIRSSMLEILNQDYIRTARSKGISEFNVIIKHGLRNGLNSVITIVSLQLTSVIGGTLITETVFAWPGLGQLLVTAINNYDMSVVQAAVFIIAILVIFINIFTDVIYRLLDPRIKHT